MRPLIADNQILVYCMMQSQLYGARYYKRFLKLGLTGYGYNDAPFLGMDNPSRPDRHDLYCDCLLLINYSIRYSAKKQANLREFLQIHFRIF